MCANEILFLKLWNVYTCIYGWDPRLRSVFIFQSVRERGDWKTGALLGDFTAERVGARHNDCLHKWSS